VTTVVVLAKEPVPGRVKTRLHARFTPQQAARLATAALADTIAAVRALPVRPVLAYDGRPGDWQPRGFHQLRQSGGDLSERIEQALYEAQYELPDISGSSQDGRRYGLPDISGRSREGAQYEVPDMSGRSRDGARYEVPEISGRSRDGLDFDLPGMSGRSKVLLVGMDTPQLGAALREVSWEGADAVLGLTEDGGYWAIGLRRFVPECVAGVPMSTERTGADQLERLRSLGLRVRLLPVLRDVDTPADAAAVAAAEPQLRFSAVHRRLVAAGADHRPEGERVFDLALAGEHGGVAYVDPASGAAPVALDHDRWQQPADEVDRLVLSRCRGPALDIGCGPGRIVRALAERGVAALGVDTSPVAVALTAERGAAVLHRAVQRPLPGEGRWGTVLLMDGNIGIGGDPEVLLRRCRQLVRDDGTVIVEVDPDDSVDETTALAVFDDTGGWTEAVPWSRTGAAACRDRASRAGLTVAEDWMVDGRRFLSLRPATT